MNIPDILHLTTLAASLAGKQIRLNGTTLKVHTLAIDNRESPRLLIETSLEPPNVCSEPDCSCPVCLMAAAIPKQHAADVIALLCQGMSDSYILDSSFVSEDGFHIKIRHLHTQSVSVGLGGNLPIAIGRAVTAAANAS
jgi:hypothetical protein